MFSSFDLTLTTSTEIVQIKWCLKPKGDFIVYVTFSSSIMSERIIFLLLLITILQLIMRKIIFTASAVGDT